MSKAFRWVTVGVRGQRLGSLPAAVLSAAVQLRLTARKQPVCARMIQKKLDGGFDVMHEVRRLCVWRRGQILQDGFIILGQPEGHVIVWCPSARLDFHELSAGVIHFNHLSTREGASGSELLRWSSMCERGWKHVTCLNIHTYPIHHGPMNPVFDDVIHVCDAARLQVNLLRLLLKGSQNAKAE